MKKTNQISILMCVCEKDNPEYLIKAFESLIDQTYFFYELILVKDGKLNEKLEEVINNYIKIIETKIIFLEKNVGLPQALNIGLLEATSKWIGRFDSDDICDKNRFKIASEIIKIHGNKIDIFGTYMKEFIEDIHDSNKIRFVPLNQKGIEKKILLTNPMNHISVFFKKELIKKYSDKKNEFYPLIDGFEDYALWIKLIKNGVKFRNFPIVTVYARVGNEMLKRRGGIKYIFNEIKLRKFSFKYFNIFENFLIFFISFIRITIFLLPINLKRNFYKIKRIFL